MGMETQYIEDVCGFLSTFRCTLKHSTADYSMLFIFFHS
jgi:hypothetical protein